MDTTNIETQAPVITLTDAAVKEVKRLINVQGIEEGGLRLGVKGGGCSGLSYTINFDDKIGQYDQVYEINGVKVIENRDTSFRHGRIGLVKFRDTVASFRRFAFGTTLPTGPTPQEIAQMDEALSRSRPGSTRRSRTRTRARPCSR